MYDQLEFLCDAGSVAGAASAEATFSGCGCVCSAACVGREKNSPGAARKVSSGIVSSKKVRRTSFLKWESGFIQSEQSAEKMNLKRKQPGWNSLSALVYCNSKLIAIEFNFYDDSRQESANGRLEKFLNFCISKRPVWSFGTDEVGSAGKLHPQGQLSFSNPVSLKAVS